MIKAVKVLVEFTSERFWVQEYDGLDYGEASTNHVRTYPLIDIPKLARIICRDLEDIYLKSFGRFVKFYDGSPEHEEVVRRLESLNPQYMKDVDPATLLEINISSATYYMRRYLREYIGDKSKRNRRQQGFTVRVLLKDLVQAFREIPVDFTLLSKECIGILDKVSRYLPIQEHVHIRLHGDLRYTKQYMTEFLIETANKMAPAYFLGFFVKNKEIENLEGAHVYRPFVDRLESILEDSVDQSLGYIHRELFGRKPSDVEYMSSFDSLYITIGGRVLVPALKEEVAYLNKDYEIFSSLPNKFLIDGNIVIKEGVDSSAKPVRLLVPLDLDFLSIGEAPWRPSISTEGFVLDARNLFAVNMDYVKANLETHYKVSHTMARLVKESNADQLFKAIARSMPAVNRDAKLAQLLRTVISNNLEEQIYDFLIKGMYQDYRYEVGAENLFNILQSKLFGIEQKKEEGRNASLPSRKI